MALSKEVTKFIKKIKYTKIIQPFKKKQRTLET